MKKASQLVLAGTAVLAVAGVVFGICVLDKKKTNTANRLDVSSNVTVTAHTGCEDTSDNSLESIETGFKCGADIVEFDVNFMPNGTPVLSHDEPDDTSVKLQDAFSLVATFDKLKVNLDLKSTENIKQVYDLAVKYGISDRVFYTGVEQKDVEAVKSQTPAAEYYLNIDVEKRNRKKDDYINELIDRVIYEGAVGINMHYSSCSERLVELFHQHGLLVSVWTVNSKKDIIKMADMGVDNITTRNPAQAVALLK